MKFVLSAGPNQKNKKLHILDHKINKNVKLKIKTDPISRSWIITLMQVFKVEKFNFRLYNFTEFKP